MEEKNIYIVNCKDREEEQRAISLLKEKFKKENSCYEFRTISDTFILRFEKWIVTRAPIAKQITKRKTGFTIIEFKTLLNN
jgi:hypothetical protein